MRAKEIIEREIDSRLDRPPKHEWWGAGDPECPKEIKAANGELHTLRCKKCGQDSPRSPICRGIDEKAAPPPAGSVAPNLEETRSKLGGSGLGGANRRTVHYLQNPEEVELMDHSGEADGMTSDQFVASNEMVDHPDATAALVERLVGALEKAVPLLNGSFNQSERQAFIPTIKSALTAAEAWKNEQNKTKP